MSDWLKLALAVVVCGVVVWVLLRVRRDRQRRRRHRAIAEFRILREPLCRKLWDVAAASGKPRGLRWKQCDYAGEELFAIDQKRDTVFALVGVLVSFEAIEGGPMEDATAAGDLRAATAVFFYRHGKWTTDGRIVFNHSPQKTLESFGGALEVFEDGMN